MIEVQMPRSTYRIQLHNNFKFLDVVGIVPYLSSIGVTHLYTSPYLKAVAGSTHGYDVIDHGQLNPEIGSTEDYDILVSVLKAYGMSHVLDTVPNHMGIDTNDNLTWNSVLADGPGGQYADFFDIDWKSGHDKVLLPVLGEAYSHALAGGELHVGKSVKYKGREFPLAGGGQADDIDKILLRQHYRLCYWRVARDEINFRRFFDVTSLAAIRIELQPVFDAAYEFTFKLIAKGAVSGLRVDHPDGLADPLQFLNRLQSTFAAVSGSCSSLPVWVEKILNGDEALPSDWPVAGTSGYDFLCAVNDLFIDPSAERQISEIYSHFIDSNIGYEQCVYLSKKQILEQSFAVELRSLSELVYALSHASLIGRDYTRRDLGSAISEIIAVFPVYRTYVTSGDVRPTDVALVTKAVDDAVARNPSIDASVFHVVRDLILQIGPIAAIDPEAALLVATRFQHLTSPVNAKAVEDTVFYTFNRLTSLNEVGGHPGRFGRGNEAIHRYMLDRQKSWPNALSVLSTHDTKRSEDVRARISVLADMPTAWSECVAKLADLLSTSGISRNDQYLLLQTLFGAWSTPDAQFVERINSYMIKATREAKVETSWTDVNEQYESRLKSAVERLIAEFPANFSAIHSIVEDFGIVNSLSQTLLRLTAPGIPDTYQGTELLDFSLVDPDNRRPVDFAVRRRIADDFAATPPLMANLFGSRVDGRVKMRLIQLGLKLRNSEIEVFTGGEYVPLKVSGKFAANIFAFIRRTARRAVVVVVPRSPLKVAIDNVIPLGSAWADTSVIMPLQTSFTSVLTDAGVNTMLVADLFRDLPIALLIGDVVE